MIFDYIPNKPLAQLLPAVGLSQQIAEVGTIGFRAMDERLEAHFGLWTGLVQIHAEGEVTCVAHGQRAKLIDQRFAESMMFADPSYAMIHGLFFGKRTPRASRSLTRPPLTSWASRTCALEWEGSQKA